MSRNRKKGRFAVPLFVVSMLILAALACGGEVSPTKVGEVPSPVPTKEGPAPEPTATQAPEEAPAPTDTPQPLPTDTPIPPTDTPMPPPPTDTPMPPTDTPTPPEPPPPVEAHVVIVAIDKREEYVDIQNTGGAPQDLTGWLLLSERGEQKCPVGGVIQPGETLRIWAMSEDADKGGYNCGHGRPIWNNKERDPAVLYDATGQEVDRK